MDISDNAILLASKLIRDNQYLIKCFLSQHGVFKGIFHAYKNPRQNAATVLTPGTLYKANWRARLGEHLGSYRLEQQIPNHIPILLLERYKHNFLNISVNLLNIYLPEREKQSDLWVIILNFLRFLASISQPIPREAAHYNSIKCLFYYFLLEFQLIQDIGLSVVNLLPKFSENGQIFLKISQKTLQCIIEDTNSTIAAVGGNKVSVRYGIPEDFSHIDYSLDKLQRMTGDDQELLYNLIQKGLKLNSKLLSRIIHNDSWLTQRSKILNAAAQNTHK